PSGRPRQQDAGAAVDARRLGLPARSQAASDRRRPVRRGRRLRRSFLLKGAVELSTGYDTNPGRLAVPQGAPFYVIAPEFLAVSDWERHAVVADLRGSFTGYGRNLTPNADGTPLSAPIDIDRPNFIGHIDG